DAYIPGEGKNSWLTGTAAWTFVNISQYILGVYPTHKGLSVDPCVPSDFGDFKVTRKFRGADYEISVKTNGSQKGVKKLVVDGQEVQGTVIPYVEGKKSYKVEVTM
ncbi:MAG: glycosyl transferase, partial [Lachnospiraceae bacterium]|nr:glycosyl transferase [Lachnospiraceae bacterium]